MSLEKSISRRSKDEILRSIAGLTIDPHDYIKLTQNATQDIYTYHQGGPNGPVITNITVAYTSSSKETIDYVFSGTTTSTTTSTTTTTTA